MEGYALIFEVQYCEKVSLILSCRVTCTEETIAKEKVKKGPHDNQDKFQKIKIKGNYL